MSASPDHYCGFSEKDRKKLKRYMVVLPYSKDRKIRYGIDNKGRLFQYFPVDTDIYEGCGAWQSDSTEKWRFVYNEFRKYLEKIRKKMPWYQ